MSIVLCEICRKEKAAYVCQECCRVVCQSCINTQNLTCNICRQSQNFSQPQPLTLHALSELFPILLFFGITLTLVGFTLISLPTFPSEASTGGAGGFIWIFPLPPIMLGTGSPSIILPILLIIIIIFIAIIILSINRASRI